MKNDPSMLGNMSGTTRFALVVAVGMGLVITVILSTRERVSAQPSLASAAGATASAAEVPSTITGEWCGRLRSRLESRLNAEGRAKYPDRDVTKGVRDHVANLEQDCKEATGQPMSEHWRCRWDETFDGEERCKELRKSESRAAAEKAKADDSARQAAQAQQAANMVALRQKVSRDRADTFDADCTGQGKPSRGYRYKGATFDENAVIARADGCVPKEDYVGFKGFVCCP